MDTGSAAPLPVAHRGAHGPGRAENSPAAVQHALDLGVRAVEFDVHQLGDGALVAWHDDVVRTPGGARVRPSDLTLADVSLPRVEELLDLVRGGDVFVVFDWKSVGAEARVVRLLREHGLAEQTLVSSVYPPALAAVAEQHPRLPTGLSFPGDAYGDLHDLTDTMALLLEDARASAAMVDHRLATPHVLDPLRGRGLELFLWTAADVAQYQAMSELGPRGVMTDAIEALLAAQK